MTVILCLETSTDVCSVALCRDGKVIALAENTDKHSHASVITLLIDEVMSSAGVPLSRLSAVAVSKGPGSYTGLRVGVSTAKGLCYALGIPLISVNTLEALTVAYVDSVADEKADFYLPMLDARRMEVYAAVFDKNAVILHETAAVILDENSFSEFRKKGTVVIFGTGAAKCIGLIDGPNTKIETNFHCSATGLCRPAFKAFVEQRFEDVAYFEPYYLKDFAGTKPVKK